MDIKFRKALLEDIDEVMVAVEDARAFLKIQGNGQWQFGYPNRDDFMKDIKEGHLYLVLDKDDNKTIVGCCALTYFEEEYCHLYEGAWLTDRPYMVMHRCAVKEKYRGQGYGKALFNLFDIVALEQGYKSLRIDTHAGNSVMRHVLEKCGYEYCGKVMLYPNKDRVVYEKVL